MPEQRRFRRLGATSAAISIGAFALLIGAAPPADAATTCTPGHDAASTIKYLQCLSKQVQDGIKKLLHPSATPTTKPSTKKIIKTGSTATKKPRPAAKKNTPVKVPVPTVAGPQGLSAQKVPAAGTAGRLPQVTPDLPQVAGTTAQVTGARSVETHLIAPVAVTRDAPPQIGRPVIAATAAGVAGLVGALNLTVAVRRLRRRT